MGENPASIGVKFGVSEFINEFSDQREIQSLEESGADAASGRELNGRVLAHAGFDEGGT